MSNDPFEGQEVSYSESSVSSSSSGPPNRLNKPAIHLDMAKLREDLLKKLQNRARNSLDEKKKRNDGGKKDPKSKKSGKQLSFIDEDAENKETTSTSISQRGRSLSRRESSAMESTHHESRMRRSQLADTSAGKSEKSFNVPGDISIEEGSKDASTRKSRPLRPDQHSTPFAQKLNVSSTSERQGAKGKKSRIAPRAIEEEEEGEEEGLREAELSSIRAPDEEERTITPSPSEPERSPRKVKKETRGRKPKYKGAKTKKEEKVMRPKPTARLKRSPSPFVDSDSDEPGDAAGNQSDDPIPVNPTQDDSSDERPVRVKIKNKTLPRRSPAEGSADGSRLTVDGRSGVRLPGKSGKKTAPDSRRDPSPGIRGAPEEPAAAGRRVKNRKQEQPVIRRPDNRLPQRGKMNLKILKEINRLQSLPGFLVPKLPFSRLVREISQNVSVLGGNVRYTHEALTALQTALEMYLTEVFSHANRLANHAKRVTVLPKDLNLLRTLDLIKK